MRRPVKGESGSQKVVDSTGYDGVCHSTHENERIVETNVLHRGIGRRSIAYINASTALDHRLPHCRLQFIDPTTTTF